MTTSLSVVGRVINIGLLEPYIRLATLSKINTHFGSPSGFHLTFPNGWTISVQWGPGTYSDNCAAIGDVHSIWRHKNNLDYWHSETAEIAAWFGDGNDHETQWYHFPDGDDVCGYQTIHEIASWCDVISRLDPQL